MRTCRPHLMRIVCLLYLIGGLAGAQSNDVSSPAASDAGSPATASAPAAAAPSASDSASTARDAPPLIAPDAQPQIAFHFLKDYVDFQLEKDIATERFQGWFNIITGSLFFITGETAIGLADFPSGPMADALVQNGLAVGLIGEVDLGVGLSKLVWPVTSNRQREYQLVLSETDPVLREATAAATLKGWSDDARNRRNLIGFIDVALVPIILGMSALIETSQGAPWYSGYSSHPAIPLFSATFLVAGGISFLQTSPEEKLYQKYRAARDAVYSLPSQGR